jgi:hypothetical protein
MFELLGALVAKALEKILGEAIDIGKQSVLDRRKLFRKFFDLYESLIELEKQSKAAYTEFMGYANGTEALTRTVPRKKLAALDEALSEFTSCAAKIASIVSLYDGALLVTLNDVAAQKGMNLRYLGLIVPEAIEYELIVPTRWPTEQTKLRMSTKEFHSKMHLRSKEVENEFGIVRIDLRQREDIARILGHSETVIERISKGKEELGAFIRANFPLDKVIA